MEASTTDRIGQAELSRRLKVTPKTIRRWKSNGVLPKPYQLGTIEFWTESQISDWMNQQNLPESEKGEFKGVANA